MLSRLAASRSTALLNQVLKPCVVGAVTAKRDISVPPTEHNMRPIYNKYFKQAWPSFQMYKAMAGETSGTFFGAGVMAWLISKEIFVINDEVMLGFIMFGTIYHLQKILGVPYGKALKKKHQDYLDRIYDEKHQSMAALEEAIVNERMCEEAWVNREEFFDVTRQNNQVELELEYKKRLHEVESAVQKRLDYQVDLQNIENSIEERHMVAWVEKQVLDSISEAKDGDTLSQCIRDLNELADAKAAAV